MTRGCSGCSLKYCDGRCYQGERYLESEPTEEVIAPSPKYIPGAEFAAWLAKVDAERFTDCGPDPLKHLEPRRAA